MSRSGLWFAEPPQAGSQWHLNIEGSVVRQRSEYQDIQVLESTLFGRILVLDGIVQTTEKDEFFYHEMLVHPAMLSHPEPKNVLVIGGGDGGALRRVIEHPSVEDATMVELDGRVVEVCREHLPALSAGAFDDPRTRLLLMDGWSFVRDDQGRSDIIIVDAPDPIGPAKALFTPEFYQALFDRLTDDGVVVVQAESPLLMATQTARTHLGLRTAFETVRTYLGVVPAYPGASWCFVIAYKSRPPQSEDIRSRFKQRGLSCHYFTPGVHDGMFALPAFLERFLAESIEKGEAAEVHPFFPIAQGITIEEPSTP